jgi:hypothetical protein
MYVRIISQIGSGRQVHTIALTSGGEPVKRDPHNQ